MATATQDIKDALEKRALVIGTRQSVKQAKQGLLSGIIYSSTTPSPFLRDLEHYARVSQIQLKPFEGDSIRLGQICGKPFRILAVGVRKAKS